MEKVSGGGGGPSETQLLVLSTSALTLRISDPSTKSTIGLVHEILPDLYRKLESNLIFGPGPKSISDQNTFWHTQHLNFTP
jgi:hypothetical protein